MHHPRKSKDLFGHRQVEDSFIESAVKGTLHHAWLLSGPKGIGKATFAYQAAKFLLSDNWNAPKCFSSSWSHEAAAKVNSQSHPDLYVLEAEEENGNSDVIKIDAVRDLSQFCNMTTVSSKHKVIIIDSVNDLNANSSNALLKQLEEPHPNTFFFLICHNLGGVLPTIKSRCQTTRFSPLLKSEFNSILQAQEIEMPVDLFELSYGSISVARIITDEAGFKAYNHIYDALVGQIKDDNRSVIGEFVDDRVWNIFGQLFEMAMHKLATEVQEFYLAKYDQLCHIKGIYASAERFHLDRYQTLTLIFNGLHELHF